MSLRRTVFVAVALAVMATTAIEGVLDVVVDRLVESRAPWPAAGAGEASRLGRLGANRLLVDLLDVPLMAAVAAGGGWLLARRIARPLRQLTAATRQVASQAFPQAVSVPAGKDELAELALSFNAMAEAVQGYIERERAFTRYASHELRTPLSALRLQVERVELGHVPASEVLPVLKRNVVQLEEILAALLALARTPAPDLEQRLLSPLLHDSLAAFPLEARGRLTVRDAAPAQLKVTHARLFQQALTNLVDNALRHGSGRATVQLEAGGGAVTLRVNDDGPGLRAPDVERATEPFYRAGGQSGLGLGLSFVAFIAKALEGDLTLRNSESGLEAVLTLPIVAGA